MNRQQGVGLIEVLLAVVILSIGFLAVARMQVQSMRYSQSAYSLSQARFMAQEMSERMRANRRGLATGVYNSLATGAGKTEPACASTGLVCSPADVASADLYAWSQYLHAPADAVDFVPVLPSTSGQLAQGTVKYVAADDAWDVSVQWSEQLASGPVLRTVTVQVKE